MSSVEDARTFFLLIGGVGFLELLARRGTANNRPVTKCAMAGGLAVAGVSDGLRAFVANRFNGFALLGVSVVSYRVVW